MAKRSSDPTPTPPPGSLHRSESSSTGPSANCGYCLPLCSTGDRYPGKIRFIEPQRVNLHRRRAGCPQQRYATGEPGKVQGRDRVGIVEGSRWYQARGVSIRG